MGALPVGKSGILKNRTATTYHLKGAYRQKELSTFGVRIVNEPVVVDKNIITSYCPQTAAEEKLEIKNCLANTLSEEIKEDAIERGRV